MGIVARERIDVFPGVSCVLSAVSDTALTRVPEDSATSRLVRTVLHVDLKGPLSMAPNVGLNTDFHGSRYCNMAGLEGFPIACHLSESDGVIS